jgi:hypothetical protein
VQALIRASRTPEAEVDIDHDRSRNNTISYRLAG